MPVSHKYKCTFVHIPKTGGTSIEKALEMFADWKHEDREKLFGLIHSKEILEKKYLSNFLQHLKAKEICELTQLPDDYFVFSLVRNPWDRMVSIYHNMDVNLITMALDKGVELRNLTFNEFLFSLQGINHIHLEEQWKFLYNSQDNLLVDYLGRFEDFSRSFSFICNKLNINVELPHYNCSEHLHYREYYTEETMALVSSWYQRDIKLFSYKY